MTSSVSALRSLLAIALVGIFFGAGVAPATVVYTTAFDGDSGTTPTNWTTATNLKLDGNGWYANTTGHSLSYYSPTLGLLSFADGTIETDYRRGTSFAGIVGRLQDSSNYYHVRVNGTNLQVYRFGLGGSGTLETVAIPGYDSYPTNETWNLSATFLGPQITATLRDSSGNVVSVLNVSDPGNQLAGKAGVRGSDGATWDNFAISDINRATFAITTANGVGADAQIETRQGGTYGNSNYGAATTVQLKNAGPDPNNSNNYLSRKSYLRFDLNAMEGLKTKEAALELTAFSGASGSYTFDVHGLLDGHTGESWGESSITWNNAPGNDTASLDGVLATETVFLGQISATGYSAGQVLKLASQDLIDFLNTDSDGQVTLILTQFTHSNDYFAHSNSFYSKEGSLAFAPRLVLYAIPEPSTFVLSLLGVLSLAICRRRRTR